jgi:putative colanic acid biosynthesis acetyltransferase WcaB
MVNFFSYIFQDWQVNQDTSLKSRLILITFRLAQASTQLPMPFSTFSILPRTLYQLLAEWILGVELPWDTQVGSNLQLQHGVALVVNHKTTIGSNCILRHSTTIGNKKLSDGSYSDSPQIGNNVDIGSNVVIIGAIKVGDNTTIGAGSVVVKDIPEGAVVVGNPAKIIRVNSHPASLTSTEQDSIEELEPQHSLKS